MNKLLGICCVGAGGSLEGISPIQVRDGHGSSLIVFILEFDFRWALLMKQLTEVSWKALGGEECSSPSFSDSINWEEGFGSIHYSLFIELFRIGTKLINCVSIYEQMCNYMN